MNQETPIHPADTSAVVIVAATSSRPRHPTPAGRASRGRRALEERFNLAAGQSADPVETLRLNCEAYVRYLNEHPVYFRIFHTTTSTGRLIKAIPGSRFWSMLAYHQSHVQWIGCSLHDLIQPSFSFLVGVALQFSLASRIARGQSQGWMILHALWRSLLLILLGVFLRSIGQPQTYWTFEDTLTQIGLGYFFLFLLGLRPATVFLTALAGYQAKTRGLSWVWFWLATGQHSHFIQVRPPTLITLRLAWQMTGRIC